MNSYFSKFNKFPNNKLIKDMRSYAEKEKVPIIQDEGLTFLLFLIKTKKVRNILEIGTAIGYSAINMAMQSLDINIDTIERNEEMYNQAIRNIKKAKMTERINVHFKDALEVDINEFNRKYDLIFIDAAKAQYIKFFTLYEPLLADNGVIFTDNLLFHGLVNNSERIESKNLRNLVTKIENYNEWLANNEKYDTSFFSIGDGIAVSVKKNG